MRNVESLTTEMFAPQTFVRAKPYVGKLFDFHFVTLFSPSSKIHRFIIRGEKKPYEKVRLKNLCVRNCYGNWFDCDVMTMKVLPPSEA